MSFHLLVSSSASLTSVLLFSVCLCVCLVFSRVWLFVTPWTTAQQAPVHGTFQARVLAWLAISFSGGTSQPRDRTLVSHVSCIAGGFFTCWAVGKKSSSPWVSFTSLVKFICRYFMLLKAIVSGIAFLISLSNSSLSVYRNATDICILIWNSETLLNLFIISSNFLVESLGFSKC